MVKLARRLGPFDAALIVMGGIIGSGIFRNPSVVAKILRSPDQILAVWALGGFLALLGAFIFAELAERRAGNGGLYAYMRDAFHPVVAFMYGWTLLLVSQSGGAAASAVTFAGYFEPFTGIHIDEKVLAAGTLALLTVVNCLGVRAGSNVQNFFMLVKIAAIAALIAAGFLAHPSAAASAASVVPAAHSFGMLTAMGVAMIPVLFAYSGWQTSSFMTGELKNPRRSLPMGLIAGVGGVVTLYMLVNVISLRVLGIHGLTHTTTPASAVLQVFMGPRGAQLIAAAVCLSTFGFMSNQILTSPRVYHAMAQDGLFFKPVAWVSPLTRVPVIAIALQGVFAIIIALVGNYDQILNYVTSVDYVFFTLSAIALFIFRRRDARDGVPAPAFRVPGHPFSTAFFAVVAFAVVLDTYVKDPQNSLVGLVILLIAIPVYYWLLARPSRASNTTDNTT